MHKDKKECRKNDQSAATPGFDAESEAGAELYPQLADNQRREAINNLRRYFEIAVTIAEEQATKHETLTVPQSGPTMKERSNDILKT